MSYLIKKWHKFKCIIHPTEFEAILKELDYYFPITNTAVSTDYVIDKTSLFKKYKLYYDKIISGKKWENNDHALPFYRSITDNPSYIRYEDRISVKGSRFKQATLLKPIITVSPFTLKFDSKDRLTVIFFDSSNFTNMGINFVYPKEVYDSELKKRLSTEVFSTYQLFKQLLINIKKISSKAKIQRGSDKKILKPNFWISKRCIDEVNNNVMMKKEKLKIIN